MTVGQNPVLRNGKMDYKTSFVGGGALLQCYSAPRPATGAAITTQIKLGTFVLDTPYAPPAVDGVLTPGLPAAAATIHATGTGAWWRKMKADGVTHIEDGDLSVTGGAGDITLNSLAFTPTSNIVMTYMGEADGNP